MIAMKKRFDLLITLIVLVILCVNIGVYAESTINVAVNPDTNRVTVSGKIDEGAGKAVTIIQMKPGVTQSDSDNDNVMTYIDHADAQITSEDGA